MSLSPFSCRILLPSSKDDRRAGAWDHAGHRNGGQVPCPKGFNVHRLSPAPSFSAPALPVHACLLSCLGCIWLFATPWTVACQAPLSMGILQARRLEWVAMPSSRPSPRPRDGIHVSCVSCIAGNWLLSHWGSPACADLTICSLHSTFPNSPPLPLWRHSCDHTLEPHPCRFTHSKFCSI